MPIRFRFSGAHHYYERGGKPGFSWERLWQMLWYDPTRLLELIISIAFFLTRGIMLLWLGYRFEGIEYFLQTIYLSETSLGIICATQATLQCFASVTENHKFRLVAGVTGLSVAVAVNVAFTAAVETYWGSVALVWVSIALIEMYIIFRNYMAIGDADANSNDTD